MVECTDTSVCRPTMGRPDARDEERLVSLAHRRGGWSKVYVGYGEGNLGFMSIRIRRAARRCSLQHRLEDSIAHMVSGTTSRVSTAVLPISMQRVYATVCPSGIDQDRFRILR